MGDGIQAAKAGILEIGDVYVVNKADRDGADSDRARAAAHADAGRAAPARVTWRPPVREDGGVVGRGDRRAGGGAGRARAPGCESTGALADRRRRRVRAEIEALALDTLHRRLSAGVAPGLDLDTLAARVLAGSLDPYSRRRPPHAVVAPCNPQPLLRVFSPHSCRIERAYDDRRERAPKEARSGVEHVGVDGLGVGAQLAGHHRDDDDSVRGHPALSFEAPRPARAGVELSRLDLDGHPGGGVVAVGRGEWSPSGV